MRVPLSVYTVIALAVCAPMAIAQSPPLEFKGVPLGATQSQLQERLPFFTCGGDACVYHTTGPLSVCMSQAYSDGCIRLGREMGQFGPAHVGTYTVVLQEGIIRKVGITFRADDFAALVLTLREKYGKPASDVAGALKNRMGAEFDNRIVTWNRPDGKMIVEKRSTSVELGALIMTARGFEESQQKDATEKAKAAVSKL